MSDPEMPVLSSESLIAASGEKAPGKAPQTEASAGLDRLSAEGVEPLSQTEGFCAWPKCRRPTKKHWCRSHWMRLPATVRVYINRSLVIAGEGSADYKLAVHLSKVWVATNVTAEGRRKYLA